MPAHGLNKRTITIANADAYGAGWALTDAGQVSTDGLTGYVEGSAVAAVQPLGTSRMIEDPGSEQTGGYKFFFYNMGGGWPLIRGGPDLPGTLLPTLVSWDGLWYEVQIVRDWKHGMLPHIYAEGTLLGLSRPAAPVSEDVPDTGDETVW